MAPTLTRTAPEIAKATAGQEPTLSRTLARAFYDDPVSIYLWPDPASRLAKLNRFFLEIALPETMPHGQTYANAETTGAALWVPPGDHPKPGLLDQLRQLRTIASLFGRDTRRALRALSWQEDQHPHEPHHYYLWLLGVNPEHQGQGIGSALLQPVLDRADDEGVPAYVEATSERNRALYGRHGFEDVKTVYWPDGGPPLFLMWREPR